MVADWGLEDEGIRALLRKGTPKILRLGALGLGSFPARARWQVLGAETIASVREIDRGVEQALSSTWLAKALLDRVSRREMLGPALSVTPSRSSSAADRAELEDRLGSKGPDCKDASVVSAVYERMVKRVQNIDWFAHCGQPKRAVAGEWKLRQVFVAQARERIRDDVWFDLLQAAVSDLQGFTFVRARDQHRRWNDYNKDARIALEGTLHRGRRALERTGFLPKPLRSPSFSWSPVIYLAGGLVTSRVIKQAHGHRP